MIKLQGQGCTEGGGGSEGRAVTALELMRPHEPRMWAALYCVSLISLCVWLALRPVS